jgi:hypothetical protein
MATTTSSSSAKEPASAHVLLLPYPGAQGHTNPLLQFGRRLAHYGLHPTLVTTRYVLSTTPPPDEPFSVAAISDGGAAACPDSGRRLEALGAETLADLITTEAREGRSVQCSVDLIYCVSDVLVLAVLEIRSRKQKTRRPDTFEV